MVEGLHVAAAAARLASRCHAVCVQLKELRMPSEEEKAGKKKKKQSMRLEQLHQDAHNAGCLH